MSDHSIQPTHTCFDDSIDLMWRILRNLSNWEATDYLEMRGSLRLAHGLVGGVENPSAHAWVERADWNMVFFVGLIDGKRTDFVTTRDAFYEGYKIIDATYYDYLQVQQENRQHQSFGPWTDEYRSKCGRDTTVSFSAALPIALLEF